MNFSISRSLKRAVENLRGNEEVLNLTRNNFRSVRFCRKANRERDVRKFVVDATLKNFAISRNTNFAIEHLRATRKSPILIRDNFFFVCVAKSTVKPIPIVDL